MCGYINDAAKHPVASEDIIYQFRRAMGTWYRGQPYVKIYTSGSFLDDDEIPETVRTAILTELVETDVVQVCVETRPTYIEREKLSRALACCDDISLELAIGLESANDTILRKRINKGFTYKDYLASVKLVRDLHIKIRTYLLLKPPFLTEREAMNDVLTSINKIATYSDAISINPVNVQNYTVVEYLWKRNLYRPPWLWSLVEILCQSNKYENTRVISKPIGGGKSRGTHNCGSCDTDILCAIQKFSLTQDVSVLRNLSCSCKREWLHLLELERFMYSPLTNIL
jgi:hypothetical protein